MDSLCLYLASASPRRLELLRQIGLQPLRIDARVDETPLAGETAEEAVRRLARAKAEDAARRDPRLAPGVILGADTAVVVDREMLGKPRDADEAARMLRRLRGRTHRVLTGVSLRRTDDDRDVTDFAETRVRFREFDDRTLAGYVASGEPADKAGAYGIQGRGAILVDRIEGSWSNVVGLPLERLPDWLKTIGVSLAQLGPDY